MTEPSTVQVIPLAYDLIVWSSTKLAAFPRKHRFTLGDRLMTCQLGILELLIIAQFEPACRAAALRDANLALENSGGSGVSSPRRASSTAWLLLRTVRETPCLHRRPWPGVQRPVPSRIGAPVREAGRVPGALFALL